MPSTRFVIGFKAIGLAVLLTTSASFIGCSTTSKLPGWMTLTRDEVPEAIPVAWETSYDNAKSQAANSGKIIMLWFTGSDWCKYCTMLEDEVFHTAAFNEWYGDKVIPVMLDYPRQSSLPSDLARQNETLKERYSEMVTSYPTALFVDSQGEVLGKLGYMRGGAEHWIHQAESVLSTTW